MVLNEVLAGRFTGQETAEVLGVTVRHLRRLLAAYRRHRAVALVHGNRDRPPANKREEATRQQVLRLAQTYYLDYNDSHFTEELWEQHGLQIGSVRNCV